MTPDKPQLELEKRGRRFDVQVGFARITVNSGSVAEAIAEARRQLSLEMPRFWDVIFRLDDARFVVAPLD